MTLFSNWSVRQITHAHWFCDFLMSFLTWESELAEGHKWCILCGSFFLSVLVRVRWSLSRCWFLLQTCSLGAQSCLRIINVDTSRYQAYTCFKAVARKHANVSSPWCTDMTRLKACHACISYSVSLYEQLTKCNWEPHDWWFDTLFSRNTPKCS